MIEVRDTFLHFLADNLVDIAFHYVRRDSNDPSGELLLRNAVNVEFLGAELNNDLSKWQVAVDIVADDEETAVTMLDEVWKLLKSAFYTPILNGTGNIMWDRRIPFRKVDGAYYYQFSAIFNITYAEK